METDLNPTIRRLCIRVMDDLIERPMSMIISEKEKFGEGPLSQIRQELNSKRYVSFSSWEKAVLDVFREKKISDDEVLRDCAYEMEQFFMKKCTLVRELSQCHFKDLLQEISDSLVEISPTEAPPE